MKDIIGNSPLKGKSEILDQEFQKWWLFLTSLGIFSFVIAVGIHGSKYEQGKAIASLVLVVWLWIVGRNKYNPKYIKNIEKRDPSLAKEIKKEYLHVKYIATAYFPFMLGSVYLALIAMNNKLIY
jgi:hypothetical protein